MVSYNHKEQTNRPKAGKGQNMVYYLKRTTKFFGGEPFTVVINDYSNREIAEKALKILDTINPFGSNVEFQKFFIEDKY